MDTVALLLRVRFFGVRIQKWICDLRSYGFFTTKKTILVRKTTCQKYFFQILSQKNVQIVNVNLKNPDLDLIRRIHPENHGFMIRFWICPPKHKIRFWIFPKSARCLFDAITVSMETVIIMLSIVSKSK